MWGMSDFDWYFALSVAVGGFGCLWFLEYVSRLGGLDFLNFVARCIEPARYPFWWVGYCVSKAAEQVGRYVVDFLSWALPRCLDFIVDAVREIHALAQRIIRWTLDAATRLFWKILTHLTLVEIFVSFAATFLFLFWIFMTPFLVFRGMFGKGIKPYAGWIERKLRNPHISV